jgi:hypothetical protein
MLHIIDRENENTHFVFNIVWDDLKKKYCIVEQAMYDLNTVRDSRTHL